MTYDWERTEDSEFNSSTNVEVVYGHDSSTKEPPETNIPDPPDPEYMRSVGMTEDRIQKYMKQYEEEKKLLEDTANSGEEKVAIEENKLVQVVAAQVIAEMEEVQESWEEEEKKLVELIAEKDQEYEDEED